jgi:hypothetical protein
LKRKSKKANLSVHVDWTQQAADAPHVHRFRSPLLTVYETALQRKSPESFAPKASSRSAQQ